MATVHPILAERTAGITELRKNPMAVVEQGEGFAVAVLNHHKPVFYCVPAKAYEALMDYLDELELAALVAERAVRQRLRSIRMISKLKFWNLL